MRRNLPLRSALVFLAVFSSWACERSREIQSAVGEWDSEKQEATALLVRFLRAAAAEDSRMMRFVGTDSIIARRDVRDFFRADIRAAAQRLRVVSMERGPCVRHLGFRYVVNGNRRSGAADMVFDGSRWRVRNIGYVLEHAD